jgi:hypothetical protein
MDNVQAAALLRSIADELDASAGRAPGADGGTDPDDPFAGVEGPPAGVDPMQWAAENPEAGRLWALKITHDMIGGRRADRDLEREERLRQRDEAEANRDVPGNVALNATDAEDRAYWRSMAEAYRSATGGRDLRLDGVLGGRKADLDSAWKTAQDDLDAKRYDPSKYRGKLRDVIARMMGQKP